MPVTRYRALVCTIVLAGCADAVTAPAPASRATLPTDAANKNLTVVTSKATIPFTIAACNGEPVVGQSQNSVYIVSYSNTSGTKTANGVLVTDQLTGVGSVTGAKYTGFQITATGAATVPQGQGFLTESDLLLKGTKNVPTTYVGITTIFVTDSHGNPVVSKVRFVTSCTSTVGHHHDDDDDDDDDGR